MNSTRSAPLGPISSRGSSSTSNAAPSIASDGELLEHALGEPRRRLSPGRPDAAAPAPRARRAPPQAPPPPARSRPLPAPGAPARRGSAPRARAPRPRCRRACARAGRTARGAPRRRRACRARPRANRHSAAAPRRDPPPRGEGPRAAPPGHRAPGRRPPRRWARFSVPASSAATPGSSPLGRDRLRPGPSGREQAVELAQPRALRHERPLLLLARVELLDLLDLEREQVEVTVARARRARAARPALPPARRIRAWAAPRPRAQLELIAPAEAVQQVELRRGEREPPVLVLPEEGDHPAAERLKVGRRGGATLHEGARAPLGADPPRQHDLVELLPHALAQIRQLGLLEQPRRQLEHALHVGLRRARPDDARARLAAQQEVERVGEHGLPGTRLPRDRGEPVARPQLRPLDQEQVLYAQLEQHRSGVPARPDGAAALWQRLTRFAQDADTSESRAFRARAP